MPDESNIVNVLGGATEVAFLFDTTASMDACIAAVRERMESSCEGMFGRIRDLRIGGIGMGDLCDGDNCIHKLPLTDNREDVFNFLRDAPNTSGGDAPECYEYGLHVAQGLGWSKEKKSGRALIVIGDATPHFPHYYKRYPQFGEQGYDWRAELKTLLDMGVFVHPLQCLYCPHQTEENEFWEAMAEMAGTEVMRLNDFNESSGVFEGMAFAAAGSAAYEAYEASVMDCSENKVSVECAVRMDVMRSVAAKYDMVRTEGETS